MNVTDLGFTMEELNEHVENGYVGKVKHPEYPIWIYKYSFKAAMEKMWNAVTLNSRSLVLDEYGEILSLPFAKFFNNRQEINKSVVVDEIGRQIPLDDDYVVTEKKDGSFIQMFVYQGNIIFTSSSTFESEHAKVAKQLFWDKYNAFSVGLSDDEYANQATSLSQLLKHNTIIFELIHPDYRIVIDYKDEKELYLIGIISLISGNAMSYDIASTIANRSGWKITPKYDLTWEQMIKEQLTAPYVNREGYVVYFPATGTRVKIKLNSYFEAHKLVSNLTSKNILINFCINDGKELYSMLPDEFYQYVLTKIADFNIIYDLIDSILQSFYEGHKHLDRKSYAVAAQDEPYKNYLGLLMSLYLGRTVDIWEYILKNVDKYEIDEEING